MSYVLVAEDDEDDCLLAEDAWEESGAEVPIHFVHDGVQLLEAVHKDRLPALVILDLNMPQKDGRETLRELKASGVTSSIPVVILTTSNHPEDVRSMYAMGASGYLVKPASFDGLIETMSTLKSYWFKTVELPSVVSC